MEDQTTQDFNADELDALIKRVEYAEKFNLALTPEDTKLLLNALLRLCCAARYLTVSALVEHSVLRLI